MTAAAETPDAAAQIQGLIFAVMLIDPAGLVAAVNPAAEELLGRSSSRLVGHVLGDALDIDSSRVTENLAIEDMPLVARGIGLMTSTGLRRVNLTSSPLATHSGWRVLTLSEIGQVEFGESDDDRAGLRAPAVLAHEIKNPLSAIRGASQLLARRIDAGDRPLAKMIETEVDRIARLIDRMQELGSKGQLVSGPCNLHEVIRNAMATVRASRNDNVELVEEFDPSLPAVATSADALGQVLINLLANACDASSGGLAPLVTVKTRYVSGLTLSAIRLGKATRLPIEVTVLDNGPGVDPAVADHVFEPFVSTKPQGQGLGLALVRKLVRDMGGRIVHERNERAGLTVFRLNLPVVAQQTENRGVA